MATGDPVSLVEKETPASSRAWPASGSNRRRRRDRHWLYPALSAGTIIVCALLWYVLTGPAKAIPAKDFPSVHATWRALSFLNWTLAKDAGTTAWRVIVSWVLGSLLGAAIGLVMSRSRVMHHVLNPVIEGIRPIPMIAMIPFTLLWFGLTNTGRLFLGVVVCALITVVATIEAARNVNPVLIRAAQSLGATENQVYRKVVLPSIAPTLLANLRITAALTWAVIVGAEFLGAQSGIGYLILAASNSVDTAVVLVGTVTVGVEAFLLEQLIRIGSRRATRWVDRRGNR